jgi:heme exporter protein B
MTGRQDAPSAAMELGPPLGPWRAFAAAVSAIAWKDAVAEWRTREFATAVFVFGLLVVLAFNLAFELRVELARAASAGVLWLAILFGNTLGLSRSMASELEERRLIGLVMAPVDRAAIFVGKWLASLIFSLLVGLLLLAPFVATTQLDDAPHPSLLLVLLLGAAGLTAAGTLLAALAAHTRASEVLLPVILYPLVLPLFMAALKATQPVLEGRPVAADALAVLAAYDIIFVSLSLLAFERVVDVSH